MAAHFVLPPDDPEKAAWLLHFATRLHYYADKYGITIDELNDVACSAPIFSYLLNYYHQHEDFLAKLLQYKNKMRDGVPAGTETEDLISLNSLAIIRADVSPGIFIRAKAIAMLILEHPDYAPEDGEDLGISLRDTGEHENDRVPHISVKLNSTGQPVVCWPKTDAAGIEIYKDCGSGWQLTAYDTYPDYLDKAPLPDRQMLWKYRAVYRHHDGQVGMWSNIVSIVVQNGNI